MTDSDRTIAPLVSTYADDPDLAEIVEMFVDEMPERIDLLLRAYRAGHWDDLHRLAHQLKGAAGSYGFAPITPRAARLETAVRNEHTAAEIRHALDELVALCQCVRRDSPSA
jgi:HPt (histidine-containing phosphotransfer) domain-containing protein